MARNVLEPVEIILAREYAVTEGGCWRWTRATNADGYGILWRGNRSYLRAHVASYEHHVGPVPVGLTLDHVCHALDAACPGGSGCPHRRCINPDHLEPVTSRENVLRGDGVTAHNARKTHCKRGHEFTPENTRLRPGTGWRTCIACTRIYPSNRRSA